jgi:glutamate/tyrosine decarboxylase-like PLP-dependent enzyme
MFNNPTGAGTMTSGGTESIIMAVKTYRDWARATKGITEPEMSVCDSGCLRLISHSIQGRSYVRPRRLR